MLAGASVNDSLVKEELEKAGFLRRDETLTPTAAYMGISISGGDMVEQRTLTILRDTIRRNSGCRISISWNDLGHG